MEALEGRPWKSAILYMFALGGFFCLSYGFTNWLTSQRAYVPSLVFSWERNIPFLPWTIVPYWSIDLFYCASFFIPLTRLELNQHVKRLLAAQVVSAFGFLLFPLRFTFPRPPVHGIFGWMFSGLAAFDGPFNQAPSLHLSLAVILAAAYSAHANGPARWLLQAWFALIGISALTTYQHHFIDIPTGIAAGALCCALFPDAPRRRLQLSARYFLGSVLLTACAARLGSWAWWLLWPAAACLIVSLIYFAGRPDLFRALRWFLLPYTAAAWLNARWWTRREPAARPIADGVWLGRHLTRVERRTLGIASVVDLAAELPPQAGVEYRSVPALDLTVPNDSQLDLAVAAIESLEAHRPTLVCCAMGFSRSATAVAAWLMATQRAHSVEDAIAIITQARRIVLTGAHRTSLHRWAREANCICAKETHLPAGRKYE